MKRWVVLAGLGAALGAGWIVQRDSRGAPDPAHAGVVIVPGRDAVRAPVGNHYPVKPSVAATEPEKDFGPGGIWDDRGASDMWALPEPPTAAD